MTNTRNSVAPIVGGSSGMGLETARLLRARGQDLVLVSKNREKSERARAGLADAPGGGFKPNAFMVHTAGGDDRYRNLNRAFFFVTQAVGRNAA